MYVGKAKNLKKRVSSYFRKEQIFGEKTKSLIGQIAKIKIIKVTSELESLLLEANLIKKYSPSYNVKLTDGKAYPLIRITIKDKYPKVLVARRMNYQKSIYFGPYPNAGSMRLVLRMIRRIFPFQSVLNHPNKLCLYHHLGLCPCPTVFDTKDVEKSYKKNIKSIVKFLNGKVDKLVSELEKEREILSRDEQFEEAKSVQEKIEAIKLITQEKQNLFEYEINPNLSVDLRLEDSESLKSVFKENGIHVSSLNRIECFDISNIRGKSATGSMIVFTNGEKDKSQYRRFRIIESGKANDVAMISEILIRRFKHLEWSMPALIIVDGGKPQISAAKKALDSYKFNIPIIGLAKREETIITEDFKSITLQKNSHALHLLMRIRDEAHRFAITYHKKLRSKLLLS